MARYGERNYRIGVDVGNRSVGLSAIEFDENGMPTVILRAVSFRHDGGIDPTTNKTPKSRKETAGVARRVRRMRKRRAQRLAALDRLLVANGFPLIDVAQGETYESWEARARCVEEFISDDSERLAAVSRSVRHMARHRGWRNAWLSWTGVNEVPVPTEQHLKNIASLNSKLGTELAEDATLAQMAVAASKTNYVFRPRGEKNRKNDPIIEAQVQQYDQLAELKTIMLTQKVEADVADQIIRTAFDQVRPYVPDTNIGRDALPGMEKKPRAPRASLAFQEFRVRAAVADLRFRETARGKDRAQFTPEDQDVIVNFLLTARDEDVTWSDIAEQIGIETHQLVAPTFEDIMLKHAPVDETSTTLEKVFTSSKHKKTLAPVAQWWSEQSQDMRELLVQFISDPSDNVYELADESGLSDVMNAWSDEAKEVLMNINFDSGRAAYSVESLRRLNARMAQGHDLHDARKLEFGVDDSWRPPLPSLDDRTGQPAVDRVLTIVRRFVMGSVDRWGIPNAIVVEHAREGFMGAAARDQYLKEVSSRTAARYAARKRIQDAGVERPTDGDVARWECHDRQRGCCAYCGTEITPATCEIDHIIPRAGGGSNVKDNLVATCRRCNATKGKVPFAVYAADPANHWVTLADTLKRVNNFDWSPRDRKLKQRMIQRIKRTDQDPEIDERSLASTAYAAVEVRARLVSYLSKLTGEDELKRVQVYTGGVSREARRSGKIDQRIRIRGKNEKDRFDVRHHAIDASVMTLFNPSVALTLEERSQMRRAQIMAPAQETKEWIEYTGRTPAASAKFELWRQQSGALAELLVDSIQKDEIAVAQQLRLGPSRGAVHKDTIAKLQHKPLGSEWSRADLLRVVDYRIFGLLRELADAKGNLPEDVSRILTLQDGTQLSGTATIEIFAKAAASIKVNNGSVEIGEQIHHARVYSWPTKTGTDFGILRVFTAEIPLLQKLSGSKDIMTMTIDSRSMSYRDLQPTVAKKIETGEAQEIGWIAVNDELVLDVGSLTSGKNAFAEFLLQYPESRWKVDGFKDNARLRVRPLYLSREGIQDGAEKVILDTLDSGSFVSVNPLLKAVDAMIRRDGLGAERWSSTRGLPVSWKPNGQR